MKNLYIPILTLLLFTETETFSQSNLDVEMVFVEGGEFIMGSNWNPVCSPEHKVNVPSFYIGKYEITQEQWVEVMGELPKSKDGKYTSKSLELGCPKCPVEGVEYDEVMLFIEKLNTLSGQNYRLPTESEWEFAAIGGNKSKGFFFSGGNNAEKIGWTIKNSDTQTHPVGLKQPNELGIFDMNGNVFEVCSDWFNDYNTPKENQSKEFHILRGGGYNDFYVSKINWLKLRIPFSYRTKDDIRQMANQTYPTYYPLSSVGLRLSKNSK